MTQPIQVNVNVAVWRPQINDNIMDYCPVRQQFTNGRICYILDCDIVKENGVRIWLIDGTIFAELKRLVSIINPFKQYFLTV